MLSLLVDQPISLKNDSNIKFLYKKIISLLCKLFDLDINENIKIKQPFSYSPYVNLKAGFGHLNGKRIFPIGDSLYCGNPKYGNGFVSHLEFINELVEKISNLHKNQTL